MRNRVTTGVSGLDEMLSGGIPEGNQIVLVGGPGAGKSLTCFEYLYKNAVNGEKGLYVAFEEKAESIISNAKDAFTEFKDIDKMIESQMLSINSETISSGYTTENVAKGQEFSKYISRVVALVKQTGIKHLVVDSLSVLRSFINDEAEYRVLTYDFTSSLRDMGITTIFTLEVEEYDPGKLKYPLEFFLYDGLIMFHSTTGMGKKIPSIEIVKMRGTDHSYYTVPYKITNNGVRLLTISREDE